MNKITKLVIPVAGLGTRLLPASKTIPKEMFPVLDKPMLHLIVEEAAKSGIEEVFFITNGYKKSIEDYFDTCYELEDILKKKKKFNELAILEKVVNMVKVYYVRQREPLGTAHAINLAKSFINDGENFAVMWGEDIMYSNTDEPVLKQAINVYEKYNCNVISAFEVPMEKISSFGALELSNTETLEIKSVVEKPKVEDAKSNLASVGPYIVSSNIFKMIENLPIGVGNEYQFTDAMSMLMKQEKFYANKFDGHFYATGDKMGFLRVNVDYALKDPQIKDQFIEYLKSLDLDNM